MLGSRKAKEGECYEDQTNLWSMKFIPDGDHQDIGITVPIVHRKESLIHIAVCLHM
jgi:hypothetical protein